MKITDLDGDLERLQQRFWKKVHKGDGCWTWTAPLDSDGYGQIAVIRRRGDGTISTKMLAHRLAWLLTHGYIPEGMKVIHGCLRSDCVRPHHLFLGTRLDVARLNKATGRIAPFPLGEGNPNARLTEERVRTIRRLLEDGESKKAIARREGVMRSTVALVGSGQTWSHVS